MTAAADAHPSLDWPFTAEALDGAAARADAPTALPIRFAGDGRERGFSADDAALAHGLANLPYRGRLPVARLSGALRGADLAVALFCPVLELAEDAALLSGFGHPGAAAVYLAASRRVGSAACERLLFGPAAAPVAETEAALFATRAGTGADGTAARARASTLLSVAKANLVTWPLELAALFALVDDPEGGAQPARRAVDQSGRPAAG